MDAGIDHAVALAGQRERGVPGCGNRDIPFQVFFRRDRPPAGDLANQLSNQSRRLPKLSELHKLQLLNLGIILLYKYSFRVYHNSSYPKRVTRRSKEECILPYPNINAERVRMGLTMEDFADELGVTRKTVYNWMAHGNIPQGKLEAMSEMFHCSGDYLLETRNKESI